ncbi:DNA polymerase-3 subunit chi [Rhizobium sp. SG_E_25_P2]|uniref:DNA polymerase III subunit chi n=1 Tax=Rhizobium sp. SG_E_25_P2 TaxID=2879942 RepID=UPI002474DD70|nr:DNA polymerase III subunit chi [Rhizobium sp. SG_E_25_P2]MDH6266794.1 DNA polymerase-3 subunit chi [Rhizobium sp. SG_E_25_P2]
MDILFYHLTETKMEDALPPLLEKSLERKWRVAVQTTSADREAALDAHLWTYRAESFLPHGLASEEMADAQPILITSATGNPNAAHIRFYVDGAVPEDIAGYERLVLMFDGHDEAQLAEARAQWKRLKASGGQLSYWQQNNDGRWAKKA